MWPNACHRAFADSYMWQHRCHRDLCASIVRLTFQILEGQADASLQLLFAYFTQQWLDSVRPVVWNVYNEDVRTNNDCEGWHVQFNAAVRRHHPNIWQFMECMRQEQANTEVLQQQILTRRTSRRHKKAYRIVQKRLRRLQRRYDAGNLSAASATTSANVIDYCSDHRYDSNISCNEHSGLCL